MNEEQKLIDIIIEKLQPTPAEYMANDTFMHLMDYALELDELTMRNYEQNDLVDRINKQLQLASTRPEHEAACDVASTIESLIPSYRGKFMY